MDVAKPFGVSVSVRPRGPADLAEGSADGRDHESDTLSLGIGEVREAVLRVPPEDDRDLTEQGRASVGQRVRGPDEVILPDRGLGRRRWTLEPLTEVTVRHGRPSGFAKA
jgi:hypothetical protein